MEVGGAIEGHRVLWAEGVVQPEGVQPSQQGACQLSMFIPSGV